MLDNAGDAVAGQWWGANMPMNLAKYIPSANETEVAGFYADSALSSRFLLRITALSY